MVTIHLLTTDTCSKCNSSYIKSVKWHDKKCPSCFVEELENTRNILCNYDPPQDNINMYSQISPDEWYFVVDDKNTKFRVISRRVFSMNSKKYSKIYFANRLKNCLQWIKKNS